MDEILSSIRRIIADDQEAAQNGAEGRRSEPHGVGSGGPEDDVLDLAEFSAQSAAPAPPALAALDVEVPDISFRDEDEAQNKPHPAMSEAPIPVPPPPEPARPAPPRPVETPRPEPEAISAAPQARLVSPTTDASVNHAFNMLAHTVLSNNARTLEDLVKEMLRPMLKVWLDDNLPGMVERLVRAEIERVARGGR